MNGSGGDSGLVRPYVMTGGRTRATEADLPVETVVETLASTQADQLDFERKAIAEECAVPTSIAELASQLDLPLGVTRVLVTDMASAGLLLAHGVGDRFDIDLIEQLKEGIRSL